MLLSASGMSAIQESMIFIIDDINIFGAGALYQITRQYMQKMGITYR
jgi:hypothetical protein